MKQYNTMEEKPDLILFNKLFSEYRDRFIRFAYSYTSDRMAAEDIVTEAMMYYWDNRDRIDSTNIPAYILATIKNKSLNYLRDQQIHLSALDSLKELSEWRLSIQISSLEAYEPKDVFSQEIKDMVNEAMKKMSPKTRQIFMMRRIQGKSYQEIGEEMNLTRKGIEYHITKATEILRKSLKDYYPIALLLLNL